MQLPDGVIEDLVEVTEHLVYSHNFRSEDTQRRVGELLSGIKTRLAPPSEPETVPAPAPPPAPGPVVIVPSDVPTQGSATVSAVVIPGTADPSAAAEGTAP
jgi:hypothetical protein